MNATERLRQLNALLETALALPEAERESWLAALPAEQQTHAAALRSMLARAGVETDTFLRRPVAWPAALGDEFADEFADDGPRTDQAGDRVGPWRLLRELGHGGMATVWLAERADGGLQRQVALKLPRVGYAPGLAQRMARERDILAALEHPRIARLYDAGLTNEGRPWLAMEHVEGVPIDDAVRERKLGIDARLRLFLQVADAVAHAHARLVVHRDLKPSNILVTAAGEVCLLDFGVAKLLDDDTAGHEHQLTHHLGRPITPDYAAPELVGLQAAGTAADVYSLGVVLYELLAGVRPYSVGPHRLGALEDAIRRAPIEPMSAHVADRDTARALRGDLDTIVGKALRKTPRERYPSVESFAADVQRHLDGEPVLAQPPSWRYRARKFVRRRRWPLAAAAAVLGSLVAGLGAALWQADVARAEAARAEQSKQFVASILRQAQPRQGNGGAVLAADLLVVAGERIERELAGDARAAAELGVTIGEGLSMLGEPARGEAVLRAAVARAQAAWGARHPVTLRARTLLAESLSIQRPDEAAAVADAVVPDVLAALRNDASLADVATMALRQQSFQRAKRDEVEGSYAPLREALAIAERHRGANSAEAAVTLGLLSNTYGRFGEYRRQLETAQDALTRALATFGDRRPDLTLTAVERWHAEALRRNDRPGDAVPILRRVLDDQRRLDGSDTPRVRNAMFQLGLALAEAGQLGEALVCLRETVALEARQNSTDNEDRRSFRSALAVVLGFAYRPDEALALLDHGTAPPPPLPESPANWQMVRHVRTAQLFALRGDAAIATRVAGEAAQRTDDAHAPYRAEARHVLAQNARLQRRSVEALALAQQAWDDPGRGRARPAIRASIAAELGAALIERGDLARAEGVVAQSLALFDEAQVAPSPRSSAAWIARARLHLAAGRVDEAEAALLPLRAAWETAHPRSAWHGETLHWLARVHARRGNAAAQRELDQVARPLLLASPLPALRRLATG